MGIYLNPTGITTYEKAQWLLDNGYTRDYPLKSRVHLATKPIPFEEVPEGLVQICVVENTSHDAAGVMITKREHDIMTARDPRAKTFLMVSREDLPKLTGLSREELDSISGKRT
jgi:hypothetical protein